ncbi:hypothetical protein ACVDG5_003815 [Mesorhizobium sp. ORM6]
MIETARAIKSCSLVVFIPDMPASGHDPSIITSSRPRPEGAFLRGFQNVRQRAMGSPLPLEESTMTD